MGIICIFVCQIKTYEFAYISVHFEFNDSQWAKENHTHTQNTLAIRPILNVDVIEIGHTNTDQQIDNEEREWLTHLISKLIY